MGGILTRRRALLRDETAVIPPTPSGDPWYGVDWFYSGTSPQLTRIGSAANFSDPQPATSLNGSGSSPFDSIMPWAGMKRYNIINGAVSYSQDDAGFSQTNYDTVVYIPAFYYRAEKDTTEQRWTWAISPTAQEGFSKHPGSGRYVGRYHMNRFGAEVYSRSQLVPSSDSSANLRSYAHSKGASWYMLDFATWSAIQMLYLIEFAHFGSQTTLGTGYVGVTSSAASGGATDNAVYHTLKVSGEHNQYRWIEDPYSNIRDMIDGAYAATYGEFYAGIDNSQFNSSRPPAGTSSTGIYLSSGEGWSAITDFKTSASANNVPWAFVPNGSGTTDNSKYVTDGVKSGANCVVSIGGDYSSTDSANNGMFSFDASQRYNSSKTNVGTRLIFIP